MTANPRRKTRIFVFIGALALAAAGIALRFHLDFVSGFGTAFGTGALILSVLSNRRQPSAPLS